MRNRDYKRMGKQIGRSVQEAIRSRNFEGIGRAIDQSVHEISGIGKEVIEDLKENRTDGRQPYGKRTPPKAYRNPTVGQYSPPQGRPIYPSPYKAPAVYNRMPGNISGYIFTIIGAAVGIPMLFADFAMTIAGLAGTTVLQDLMIVLGVFIPITLAALALAGYGITLRRRARRFSRYRDAIGNVDFCTVAKIADIAGETQERTKKDLRKMITCGVYPQGHLDRNETCFMVDDKTYQGYLEAEKEYLLRQKSQQAEQQKANDPKQAELDAVKKEGTAYLQQIREANDALPGQEISQKLDCLETVAGRIFECVCQHPEKLPDIRRFMRYYMPTTLKLVKAYQEFEAQPVQGENILKSKQEIEKALDTVNTAFANLLDSLYADEALDVSTDISTLETMLKQEGLTGSDFAKSRDEKGSA